MKNIIISATILMLVCCGEAEATSKDDNITNQVIKPSAKITVKPVVLDLDDMSFTEAFSIEHRAKGEGHTFWWNGEQYTTDLAGIDEFVLKHISSNSSHLGWVTNNDDPDDNCKSNKLDDCGVCDGPGKMTWWRDKDGDGLGTFMEWITSCTYPTDTEIENYQAESLQEGGGDQGH
jgi:hypothetical protein